MDIQNIKIIVGIFPDATSEDVKESNFRFCHIDVDVYQSAKDIVEWIWSKMVIGGILVFDDYGCDSCNGVTKFVNELEDNNDCIFVYNLNGHAILIKTK